jgi:hypothetical protein
VSKIVSNNKIINEFPQNNVSGFYFLVLTFEVVFDNYET